MAQITMWNLPIQRHLADAFLQSALHLTVRTTQEIKQEGNNIIKLRKDLSKDFFSSPCLQQKLRDNINMGVSVHKSKRVELIAEMLLEQPSFQFSFECE